MLKFYCFITFYLHFCALFVWAGQIVISPKPNDNKINANIGGEFVITCTATGDIETKPNALEWRFGTNAITENTNQRIYTKRYGDSLQLLFHNLKPEDSGIYTCSAVVADQSSEQSIELTLQKSISFLDTPNEQQILVDKEEQLIICKAEASPGPTINWLRKGNDIRNEHEKVYIQNDDKYQITNDGLLIKNVKIEDEGIYICQALVTATGQAKSFSINVQVITPPKWIQEPKDTEGVRGQDTIIRCDATAKPKPDIKFLKNGIDIVSSDRYIIQDTMLTIRRLENSDSDTYTCIVTNKAGELVGTLKLTVLIGPVMQQMESLTVLENSDATFSCNVIEAIPPPIFQWRYADTQKVIENVVDRITIVSSDMTSELRLKNIRKQDRRNYTCVASNKAAVNEASARLLVKYPPVLIINEEARETYYSWFMTDVSGISRGLPVVFTCIADGYPETSIKWYFQQQQITEGPKYRYIRSEPGYSQIEINPKDKSDFGIYVCQADNSMGKTQRNILLLEATAPKYTPVIERSNIKPDSFILNLRAPDSNEADGGVPVQSYRIQMRNIGSDWSRPTEFEPLVDTQSNNKNLIEYEIPNLSPNTEYIIRAAAINKAGIGQWSPEINIRTPPRRQPDPVRIISPEECSYSSKCIIEWVPEGNGGSPIREYYLRWRRVSYKDPNNKHRDKTEQWSPRISLKYGTTKYEIQNLFGSSFYEIELNAINDIGVSASQPYRIRTLKGAPVAEFVEPQHLSTLNYTLIIIGIVVTVLVILLLIDLCCYFTNKCGVIMSLRKCCRPKKDTKPIVRAKYAGVPRHI